MQNEERNDTVFTEETVEPTAEETAVIEENGVIEEDPFEEAFQYTEPDPPKVSNWPVIVLAVLLVLTLIIGTLWGTGVLDGLFNKPNGDDPATVDPFGTEDVSDAVAATCGDISVSNGAIAFFMEMEYLNSGDYSSFSKTQPLEDQDAAAYKTLVDSAKAQFEWMLVMNASAKKNGTVLNQAAKKMITRAVASADVSKFHNGVTSADVEEFYTLYYTAWLEESRLFNTVTLSDDEIQKIYDEYSRDYDTCSVAAYLLYVNKDGTYKTVEEATAAAKALTDARTPEAFRKEAIRLMVETGECKDEEAAATKFDSTYVKAGIGYTEEDDLAEWLFAEDTKVGATKLISGKDAVTVYMLTKAPAKDTTPLVNTRHIFLSTEAYGDTAALEKLKGEVFAAWDESDGTQAAFEDLVREYTADFNTWDGIFWEIEDSPVLSADFTKWCFEKERKAGDVTSFASQYGLHIFYYAGEAEMWSAQVLSGVQTDASALAADKLSETYPATFKDTVIGTIVV